RQMGGCSMHEVCSRLQRETGALFDCFQQGDYVRIRTPFLYPDGDVIDLYYEEYDGMGTISDLGETVRWLGSQSASPRRSTGQKRIVEDVCLTTGVEFFRGMIQARVGKESDGLAGTLLRVAQAAVRVADIWFTFRARSIQSVNDDMATLLGDASIPFEQ